jgi:hypothetical protein
MTRLATAVLALMATVSVAACSSSTAGRAADPVGTACQLLTPAIANAALPVRVYHLGPRHTSAGVTACFYGDERDPAVLSLNTVLLLQVNHRYLARHHQTAKQAAAGGANDCVPGSTRHLGSAAHIGSGLTVCLGTRGPVRGGWEQRGSAYNLDLYAISTTSESYAARLATFETAARAISANIG